MTIILTDGVEIFEVRHNATQDEFDELDTKAKEASDGNIFWWVLKIPKEAPHD